MVKSVFGTLLIAFLAVGVYSSAATLSDPAVDTYNIRVGTETFAGHYQFTTNTLLVETAEAITNLGSDIIKFYLGPDTSFQSGVTLPSNITNITMLARDEPSYRKVFDMPFLHTIVWAYPLGNPEPPFTDGNYSSKEQAVDYTEMYDLTCYLLTNYNNSGRQFYLGHWEGDGYLEVNGWTTNPSPAVVTAMAQWLNNRQKAVDDARAATAHTNVWVYNYTEVNRVRDAMLNGPTNNVRVVNDVLPYVTNIDCVSYSSYDAENLDSNDLYTTLNYIHSHIPTNKTGVVPEPRMWIGEYGHGSYTTDAQEPFNRDYIQRLLNWNYNGQALWYILYWEIYDNELAVGNDNWCLINSNDVKVASWYLENYFINDARLMAAQFKETNGALPSDQQFVSMVEPLLNQPIPAPVALSFANQSSSLLSTNSASVSATFAQGIYGDNEASVWLEWGTTDGGTSPGAWQNSQFLGVNTHFNPTVFSATLANLALNTTYYYRFYAVNSGGTAWSASTSQFSTTTLNPPDYGSSLKIFFPGYNRGETLLNVPILVNLSTNLPGFSYKQFASPTGGDLRFTDSSGLTPISHEIDEWNTNGTSYVWVNVPAISATNNYIWAYWGNPNATNLPAYSTNGTVWPNYELVWHLKETGFPYADSTQQNPALSGVAPTSTTGEIGHGVAFNGSSQYLNAGAMNLGSQFTISAWIKLSTSATNIQTIWANKSGGWNAAGFSLYVNSYNTADKRVILETGDGVNGVDAETASNVVSFGVWHLITAAINENAATAHLYVDGVDCTQSSGIDGAFPNQAGVNLGRFTNNVYYFNGDMDEARIESGTCDSNWVWTAWMNVVSNTALANYTSVAQAQPGLAIGQSGNGGTVLAWPSSGVGFTLYTATNLTPPISWTPASNQPIFSNNEWQITLPPNQAPFGYYRLQSQ